jgi:hypothetical protein
MPRRKFLHPNEFPKLCVYAPKRPRLLELASRLKSDVVFEEDHDHQNSQVPTDFPGTHQEADDDEDNNTQIDLQSPFATNGSIPPDISIAEYASQEHSFEEGGSTKPTGNSSMLKSLMSSNIRIGLDLLQLCSKAQVPLTFYSEILGVFKKHSDFVGKAVSTIPSRERLMNNLKSVIPVVEPETIPSWSAKGFVCYGILQVN